MPEATDTQGILRQNLADAGCSPETVRQCAALAQRKENGELLRVLFRRRKMLLDADQQNEKRTGCLGCLIYRMEKQKRGVDGRNSA